MNPTITPSKNCDQGWQQSSRARPILFALLIASLVISAVAICELSYSSYLLGGFTRFIFYVIIFITVAGVSAIVIVARLRWYRYKWPTLDCIFEPDHKNPLEGLLLITIVLLVVLCSASVGAYYYQSFVLNPLRVSVVGKERASMISDLDLVLVASRDGQEVSIAAKSIVKSVNGLKAQHGAGRLRILKVLDVANQQARFFAPEDTIPCEGPTETENWGATIRPFKTTEEFNMQGKATLPFHVSDFELVSARLEMPVSYPERNSRGYDTSSVVAMSKDLRVLFVPTEKDRNKVISAPDNDDGGFWFPPVIGALIAGYWVALAYATWRYKSAAKVRVVARNTSGTRNGVIAPR